MIQYKCSGCGGNLIINKDKCFASCEYCGATVPVPKMDSEEKINLMNQADEQRRRFHFDVAINMYSQITAKYPKESAAYFNLALCEFGIEYVKDHDGRSIPTFHRLPNESIQSNPNILKAIETADPNERIEYEQQVRELEKLRIRVLERADRAGKYDIFISFKQHVGDSNQTPLTWDYQYGSSLFQDLTEASYRVFFSPVSLQSVAGEEYEPYIFAALQSSKVMILLSSEEEYGNGVWVKNEWQRFRDMMSKDHDRVLIPCYRRTPDSLPEDLRSVQGFDMESGHTRERLLQRIEVLIPRKKKQSAGSNYGDATEDERLEFVRRALLDEEYERAQKECELILRKNYDCAEAHMDLALIDYQFRSLEEVQELLVAKVREAESSGCTVDTSDSWSSQIMEKYEVPGYFDEEDITTLMPEVYQYSVRLDSMREAKKNFSDLFFENKNVQSAYQHAEGDYKTKINIFKEEVENTIGRLIEEETQHLNEELEKADRVIDERKSQSETKISEAYEQAKVKRDADYEKAMNLNSEDELEESINNLSKMGDHKEAVRRKEELDAVFNVRNCINENPDYLTRCLSLEKPDVLRV